MSILANLGGALALTLGASAGPLLPVHTGPTGEDYSTWVRPDNGVSCCNNTDCFPTQARWNGKEWEARFPDGRWVKVPWDRVLKHPAKDGNAHLCAREYNEGTEEAYIIVFCFTIPAVKM